MGQKLQPTWDLDVIFPGQSNSEEFRQFVNEVKRNIAELTVEANHLDANGETEAWEIILEKLELLTKRSREMGAYISCLSAQDVTDKQAALYVAEAAQVQASSSALTKIIDQKLGAVTEANWDMLLDQEAIKPLKFILTERRERAREQLSKNEEILIGDLAVDGYHAWNQMYSTIVGNMKIDITEDGETQSYSVGQASNKLSTPDREQREYVYRQISKAWKDNEDLFGQTLNHLAGFRLQTYKHYGWDNVLKEPLEKNRMKEETLNAMWGAIEKHKPLFVEYLNQKASLLNLDQLSIFDVNAPIQSKVEKKSYDEGAAFIVEQFRGFSPQMADFAQMAFEKRWIEAEDRAGKRPGGFCTSFPASEQTRIFMTYSGTPSNIATLAHELGHGYHQYVMNDVNGLNQGYAMNVAETASTFAEMIIADASVKMAKTDEEKLTLLEDKVSRSIAFFMNIHARFLFEKQFYEERKQGMVSTDRLNELMVEAQKEAYCNNLSEYDPHFWASKLHFHITGVPFYNFPYTFGYLFSQGIYAYAQEYEGDFEEKYTALLRDTGRLTVEELAEKHLQVDLTKPDFWENAIEICEQDVQTFLELSRKLQKL
ncbi:M3 family oligoendopeptidase [Oceanobacillus neutriphilus]|uniref:Oligoendopeptidase n=1 Tax=Oceanobacillus neutriphilus TaxID=531815 RepID=A0ABQ2NT73_9BACI|nr:M3 family oligoendopeptidase [Oceanobacillus neutriphilus]GGP09659.1 oligoendopeptidase [Oceanobacillus neutriphilus]